MGLSRRRLFQNAGVVPRDGPRLHKRTIAAWQAVGEEKRATPYFRSSFWGGAFPAGPGPHCGRQAIYGLLNAPETEPIKPMLEATARAGKDVENQITYRWLKVGMSIAGIPLPESEDEPREQLRLQVPGFWLSTAIDDVLDLRPDWPAVVPVDIKSKSEEAIKKMKVGEMSYDPRHYAQVCSYIYVCRYYHEKQGWDKLGLEPASAGFIYYVSRDNPSNGVEFWLEPTWDEIEEALVRLATWKEAYVERRLPERPKAWRWTEQPCKWCPVKKLCKEDVRANVGELFESAVVADAKRINPEYNVEEIHAKVLKRWEGK